MRSKDWIRFILAATIWGISFLWIKIGMQELGLFTLAPLRVSFVLLATFIFVFWKRLAIPRSALWLLPILGLLNEAVPFVLISRVAVIWLGVLGAFIASMFYLTLIQDVSSTRRADDLPFSHLRGSMKRYLFTRTTGLVRWLAAVLILNGIGLVNQVRTHLPAMEAT